MKLLVIPKDINLPQKSLGGLELLAVLHDIGKVGIDDRIYRKAMTMEDAIEEIRKDAGTQFDPQVVEVFEKIINA